MVSEPFLACSEGLLIHRLLRHRNRVGSGNADRKLQSWWKNMNLWKAPPRLDNHFGFGTTSDIIGRFIHSSAFAPSESARKRQFRPKIAERMEKCESTKNSLWTHHPTWIRSHFRALRNVCNTFRPKLHFRRHSDGVPTAIIRCINYFLHQIWNKLFSHHDCRILEQHPFFLRRQIHFRPESDRNRHIAAEFCRSDPKNENSANFTIYT